MLQLSQSLSEPQQIQDNFTSERTCQASDEQALKHVWLASIDFDEVGAFGSSLPGTWLQDTDDEHAPKIKRQLSICWQQAEGRLPRDACWPTNVVTQTLLQGSETEYIFEVLHCPHWSPPISFLYCKSCRRCRSREFFLLVRRHNMPCHLPPRPSRKIVALGMCGFICNIFL